MKSSAVFIGVLSLLMVVGYFTHSEIRPSEVHPLWAYYAMNFVLGVATVVVLMRLSQRKPEILGFVFMGASLVKFALFFALFFPEIQAHEALKKHEFLSFFIPYGLTLISEVWFLVRRLNRAG